MTTLDSIVAAIQQHEGYIPPGVDARYPQGSLSFRNNNPGNLTYAGQPGAVLGDGGRFARFATYEDGAAALANQVKLDASRGLTLEGFLHKFAPASENNTGAYIASVSAATGIAPGQSLSNAIAGEASLPPFSRSSARRSISPQPGHPTPGYPLPPIRRT